MRNNLQELRTAAGLSQQACADALGITAHRLKALGLIDKIGLQNYLQSQT